MGIARVVARVDLRPERALAAWADLDRWPAFMEAFRDIVRVEGPWPRPGSQVVWKTSPHGRGQVTERVEAHGRWGEGGAQFVTSVSEDALTGLQTVGFAPEGGGSRVEITLDYALTQGGLLAPLTDRLFIRRALASSLERTLERFAAEAAPII